jgi:hypothetical protein
MMDTILFEDEILRGIFIAKENLLDDLFLNWLHNP